MVKALVEPLQKIVARLSGCLLNVRVNANVRLLSESGYPAR